MLPWQGFLKSILPPPTGEHFLHPRGAGSTIGKSSRFLNFPRLPERTPKRRSEGGKFSSLQTLDIARNAKRISFPRQPTTARADSAAASHERGSPFTPTLRADARIASQASSGSGTPLAMPLARAVRSGSPGVSIASPGAALASRNQAR